VARSSNQPKPNQTEPNQTKPNQIKPNQTKPNQTKTKTKPIVADQVLLPETGSSPVSTLEGFRRRNTPLSVLRRDAKSAAGAPPSGMAADAFNEVRFYCSFFNNFFVK